MNYFLFIDETGDHGLTSLNLDFPVFLLCGALIPELENEKIKIAFNQIKTSLWGNKSVVFHSRDIRKCDNEFSILFNIKIKEGFYNRLNEAITQHNYTIIASAIQKDNYIKKYGKLSKDVYELALSFIIERAIFYLDDLIDNNKRLHIVIEKRGKKEDKKLDEHFQRLLARGTGYIDAERLKKYNLTIHFKHKKENIIGLQLADLVAYPIARYVIEPNRINLAFDVIQSKIYSKNKIRYGLKIYP